jgi:mRNA interferase HigB
MRVHLIREETIDGFVFRHARGYTSFEDWLKKLKTADWVVPADILRLYNSADLLGNSSNRVVFNVAGNNYRMICKYVFGTKQVHLYICWIGTHAEYDWLCKENKQYTIKLY